MKAGLLVAASALLGAIVISSCGRKAEGPLEFFEPPKGAEVRPELQPLWLIPEFSLTERSGKTVSLADLKGKVWIADFFYASCPSTCPMLSSRLSDLHKKLKDRVDVRLVSITTDPEKDTIEVLKGYAERFEASDRWLFLTGEKEAIRKLSNEGFKLSFTEDPTAKEPITHSTKLVLIDKTGTVRGFYEGVGEDDTERLVKDVGRLEKE